MKISYHYKIDLLPLLLFLLIIMIIPLALFYYHFEELQTNGWNMQLLEWTALLIYTPLILHLIYLIARRITFKVTFHNDHVTVTKLLTRKGFPLKEVAGYLIDKGSFLNSSKIYFLKNDERSSLLFAVKLPLVHNKDEFLEQVFHKFKDLSSDEKQKSISLYEREKSAFLSHGVKESTSLNEKRIKNTRNLTYSFWAAAAATIIFPVFESVPIIVLIFPVLLCFFMLSNKNKVKIFKSPGGFYPYILPAILLSALASLIYGLSAITVNYNNTFWMVFAASGFIYFALILRSTEEFRNQDYGPLPTVFLAILTTMYAYGFTTTLNSLEKGNQSESYTALITEIKENSKISDSYQLVLDPFGPFEYPTQLSARKSSIRNVQVGDRIRIVVHQGLLKSHWFYTEDWLN